MQLNMRVVGHELMGQTAQAGADSFVCVKLLVGAHQKAKTWKRSYAKLYMSQSDAERSFAVGSYHQLETTKKQGELDLGTRPDGPDEPGNDPEEEGRSRRSRSTGATAVQ